MFKRRGLFIVVLLLVGVMMMSGPVSANYHNEVSYIFEDITEDMDTFMVNIGLLTRDRISASEFLDRASDTKDSALDNLERIIELESEAPDTKFHAEMVSVVSNWYLSVDMVHDGFSKGNNERIQGAVEVMEFVDSKLGDLTDRL